MRSFILFSGLLFGLTAFAFSQTDIPDKAEVSGVWQTAGSPYRINGEAIVPADSCLVIEPGVRIEFKTGSNHEYINPSFDLGLLRVKGCLKVQGTADQPVIFTGQGNSGSWGLLFFDEGAADSSYLRFATIEHASYIRYLQNWVDYYGALSIADAAIAIEHCRLINNANDGLFVKQAAPVITNCLIAQNGQNGIRALSQSDLQINSATIADNGLAGLDCGVSSQPQIINSIFRGNQNDFTLGNFAQISVSYSMLQSEEIPERVVSGNGNLWGKTPKFISPAQLNYQLSANSFAVNNGIPDTTGLQLPPTDLNGQARVRFGRIDMGAFERTDSYLRLVYPNGNEPFVVQTTETLRWQTNVSAVELQFSEDNGQTWLSIGTVSNQKQLDWEVPDIPSEECLLRVRDANNTALTDTCDTTFIIDDHAIIRDGLKVSGVWSKQMSPVEIRGTAIVPADSILRIEPGVHVALHSGTHFNYHSPAFDAGFLWVQGGISAVGTEQDSIIFDAWGNGHWSTLLLDQTDSTLTVLKFVKLQHAAGIDSVNGQNFPAALSINNTNCQIAQARISNNAGNGILLAGESAPEIHDCQIDRNSGSGIFVQSAQHFTSPELFFNRIEFNSRHGIALTDLTAAYMHDNLIEHNDSTGIYLQTGYATPRIENNRLGYQDVGLWCDNTAPKLIGDVIYHADKGIVLRTASPDMGNLTLAKNQIAIDCQEASPILSNVLFGSNTQDFSFAAGDQSAPTVSYCLTDKPYFAAQVTDAGFNRTNTNPEFAGSGEHPYSLTRGSAAIDHGTNENSLITLPELDVAGHARILDGNHDGTPQVDIGAYEFAELIAGFEGTPVSGAVPLTVQFSDHSVGNVDTRQWDFGDGGTAQDANPTHTYTKAGKFSVSLIVQGEAGQDTLTRTDYIYAKYPPFVCQFINDTSFAEDAGWQFIKAMNTIFCDSDSTSSLTFSLKHTCTNIKIRWQHDSLFVKGDSNFAGQDRMTITAKDIIGLTASDTFNLSIRQINDPPFRSKALPDSITFANDSTVQLNVWDFYGDVETEDAGLKYTFGCSSDSVFTRFDSTNGLLKIFSDPQFKGIARLFISVQDDSGAALSDTIVLNIELPTAIWNSGHGSKPATFFLTQGFPNPFNPSTTINYGLPVAQKVEIDLFDVLGRRISVLFAGERNAGTYSLNIDGNRLRLSSGIYFIVLRSPKFKAMRKIVLLK